MCVLIYFSLICLHVYSFAVKSMVHCGSVSDPGASGLAYNCTPPVAVPDVMGVRAVWWQSNNQKKGDNKKWETHGPAARQDTSTTHIAQPLTPRDCTPTSNPTTPYLLITAPTSRTFHPTTLHCYLPPTRRVRIFCSIVFPKYFSQRNFHMV